MPVINSTHLRDCRYCGKQFKPRTKEQRYCDRFHRRQYMRKGRPRTESVQEDEVIYDGTFGLAGR